MIWGACFLSGEFGKLVAPNHPPSGEGNRRPSKGTSWRNQDSPQWRRYHRPPGGHWRTWLVPFWPLPDQPWPLVNSLCILCDFLLIFRAVFQLARHMPAVISEWSWSWARASLPSLPKASSLPKFSIQTWPRTVRFVWIRWRRIGRLSTASSIFYLWVLKSLSRTLEISSRLIA